MPPRGDLAPLQPTEFLGSPIWRERGREREEGPLLPAPGTLASKRAVCQLGASSPGGGWGSPGRLTGCVVLSSTRVFGVPLIPFPGQAHKEETSQGPARCPPVPAPPAGSPAVESVANPVTLTAVYYKLIHSFRPCCSVTGCHSDRPGS